MTRCGTHALSLTFSGSSATASRKQSMAWTCRSFRKKPTPARNQARLVLGTCGLAHGEERRGHQLLSPKSSITTTGSHNHGGSPCQSAAPATQQRSSRRRQRCMRWWPRCEVQRQRTRRCQQLWPERRLDERWRAWPTQDLLLLPPPSPRRDRNPTVTTAAFPRADDPASATAHKVTFNNSALTTLA